MHVHFCVRVYSFCLKLLQTVTSSLPSLGMIGKRAASSADPASSSRQHSAAMIDAQIGFAFYNVGIQNTETNNTVNWKKKVATLKNDIQSILKDDLVDCVFLCEIGSMQNSIENVFPTCPPLPPAPIDVFQCRIRF